MKTLCLALALTLSSSLVLKAYAQDDYDVSSEEVVPVTTPTMDSSDTEIAPPPSDSGSTYVPEEGSSESMDY